MVPKGLMESDLAQIFELYGEIKEVHVIRHPSGQSKGCAFVKYYQHGTAVAAIDNLHGQVRTL
jgi:RNA recognition motif-containing protein